MVIISKRCKLEYKLGYLVSRGEEVKKIYVAEIGTLIIESTGVSITAALMCELIRSKVNVVFVMKNIILFRSCCHYTADIMQVAV